MRRVKYKNISMCAMSVESFIINHYINKRNLDMILLLDLKIRNMNMMTVLEILFIYAICMILYVNLRNIHM